MNIYIRLSFALLLWAGLLNGQPVEYVGPVSGLPVNTEINTDIQKNKTSVVVNLPFIENFSQRSNWPNQLRWADSNVYINQTMAKLPPTLGVATFDGLNKYGLPYNYNQNGTGFADALTSQPINLNNTQGSVYMSFYWQQKGFAETPEGEDSLSLQFWDGTDSLWTSVWGTRSNGTDVADSFNLEHFSITDTTWLKADFRFRFVSYGSRAGSFDIWHIDEIRLDDQRTSDDTLFNDISYLYPHQSLLVGYDAIPWFHYNAQVAANFNEQNLAYVYQRNSDGTPYNLNLGIYNISMDGVTIAGDPVGNPTFDNGHQQNTPTPFNFNINNFYPSGFTPTQPFNFKVYSTYTGFNDATRSYNDTASRTQVFDNYYAYDDGTAERTYGIENLAGAYTLMKFDILKDGGDTLRGLGIYFMPALKDPSENEFSIAIFQNNSNQPGDLIYESTEVYTPELSGMNGYRYYVLDTALVVPEAFFVGVKQKTINRLNMGFDINDTGRTTVFFGEIGNFYQSFQQGTIMMRPFFRYLPHDISIGESPAIAEKQWKTYPNPAAHTIYIDDFEAGKDLIQYNLITIGGQVLKSGSTKHSIDVSQLPEGMYILHMVRGNTVDSQKILIQR